MEGVKRFCDKRTGKKYVKLENGIVLEAVNDNDLELEEIGAEDFTYKHGYISYEDRKIGDVIKDTYRLKETLDIPVGDKVITFVVEHINHTNEYDDVYFVAKDIIGKSSMKEMDEYLDDLTDKMPIELVDRMKFIEHIAMVDGEVFKSCRKVNILSLANLIKTDYYSGKDDILFDGLQTEAERCKNYKGETDWYWICSPSLSNTTYFIYVGNSGNVGNNSYASYVIGVVPGFSIRIYNGETF